MTRLSVGIASPDYEARNDKDVRGTPYFWFYEARNDKIVGGDCFT